MRNADEIKWMILLKLGQAEHMRQFREDGLIYMNPQKYFSDLTNDSVRADRFECSDAIYQPKDITNFQIKNEVMDSVIDIPPEHMAGPVIFSRGGKAFNLFCMFSISEPTEFPIVDERNIEFGDSFVLVLNTQEFIDRLCNKLVESNFSYKHGLVSYYDEETYSGETGAFKKPSSFECQKEYRFAIYPGLSEPLKIELGSLEDITSPMHSLAEINQLLRFGKLEADEAGLS